MTNKLTLIYMKNSKMYLIEKLQIGILKTELKKRKGLDPKYSLRRFSDDAGVDNSTMSKFLKNNRKMTDYVFENILNNLSVSDGVKQDYSQKILEIDILEKKHASIRTHWYYYAILELTYLTDFKVEMEWIANKLALDLETTKYAIKLLIDVGALIEENGTYKDNLGNVTFIDSVDMDIE